MWNMEMSTFTEFFFTFDLGQIYYAEGSIDDANLYSATNW